MEKMSDDDIDYSDIPPLTEEQLKRMVRVRDLYPDGIVTDMHPERRLLALRKKQNAG
ncbi:MAG: hypothetical protein SR1Q7_13025 [Quinella sp. 1Q7]|nr:hypothetical protein [Quinella sp. 1Q7]